MPWIGLAIVVIGITGLVIADVFTDLDTVDGLRGDQIVSLVAMTALLIVIGAGWMGDYRSRSGMFLQHIAIWLGIIAVLALVYQYRATLGLNID